MFEYLTSLFALIHGTPHDTEEFLPCLMSASNLIDVIITVGNEKYLLFDNRLLETSTNSEKNLSQQAQTIITFCISVNVFGLVTILDSILLSAGGSYRTAVQVPISNDWIKESLLVFKILNKLFHLDVEQIQNWLAENDKVTELFHLMLFWMHFFTTKAQPKSLYPLIDEIITTLRNVLFILNVGLSRAYQAHTDGLHRPSWTLSSSKVVQIALLIFQH